jgi:peptide/nickel transport system ATP-binding protein
VTGVVVPPPALRVRGLEIELDTRKGARQRVVDGVDFDLCSGRTLALVGESGCGKSVTALAIMNLLVPPLRIAGGAVRLSGADGEFDLTRFDPAGREMRETRGRRIAMIFQDPMTALDPAYPVGEQIAEMLRSHLSQTRAQAWANAVEMLRLVRIPAPDQRAHAYPFQLSGGMRQRVMIAMALACTPGVLIADEPTTALDVTVQAQILEQLRDLSARFGLATLLITHDLGVVAGNADEVAVMYRGRIVESASVAALFDAPAHPYTRGLLGALPSHASDRRPLVHIPGQLPDLSSRADGCGFADRCTHAMPRCRLQTPQLAALGEHHRVACFLHDAVSGGVA